MIAEVIVDVSSSEVDRVFDYAVNGSLSLRAGFRVLVPFGRMTLEGYVIKIKEKSDFHELKEIIKVLDPYPAITQELLDLMRYMTDKYHLRMVDVLRLFIPAQMRGGRVKELTLSYARIADEYLGKDETQFIKRTATAQLDLWYYLCEVGKAATSELNKNFSAAALRNLISRGIVVTEEEEALRTPMKESCEADGNNAAVTLTVAQAQVVEKIIEADMESFLLHGVTGSGKTEVYMRCISEVLKKGKTAIMLVPEISLTPQVLRSFRSRFGQNVALLHSGLSVGERFDEWRRLRDGRAKVAVGARSAVFAPVENVGLIIIDEEHDGSYVSESNPRYVTHEVAAMRAKLNACPLVLGSATPSIESYSQVENGKFTLLELSERVNKRALPEVEIVNMCNEVYAGNNGMFSRLLLSRLTECMERDEQAIIFINRRGYSSYVMCRSCGYVAKCDQCDVSLVYHKEENVLKCHYCGNRFAVPSTCPECGFPSFKRGYVGTQAVAEQLQQLFPTKKVIRMDNDTTRTKDAHSKILGEFAAKKAQILVGTQMIAKGHDFPDVTLVGIVDADMSLHFSDFRASERTYQLLTQVAGRAGRDQKPGSVILQTYTPKHYVYRFVKDNDYKSFYEKEANLREVTKYPPFSKIVRILASGESEELTTATLKKIFDDVSVLTRDEPQSFAYFAAMKSPVKRIQNKHRMQILLRVVSDFDSIIKKVYNIVDRYTVPKVSLFVEINPNNLS